MQILALLNNLWVEISNFKLQTSARPRVPLTPALSQGERERTRQGARRLGPAGILKRQLGRSPLPLGEGQGEGAWRQKAAQRSDAVSSSPPLLWQVGFRAVVVVLMLASGPAGAAGPETKASAEK